MKTLNYFFVAIFVYCNTLIAQETVELAQLFLGITGVGGSEVVYHTIDAEGVVWEKSGNNFIISENEDIYTSTLYATGNFTSGDSAKAPFNWIWKVIQGRVAPCGLGLYKITNSKVSGKYFYLDTRDNEYVENPPGANPDVWFYYDIDEGKYRCVVKCNNYIENGSLVRASDILGFTSKTDKLQNFWSNALVRLNHNSNARIAWGPHPSFTATNYKIYRAVATQPTNPKFLTFNLIATTSSSTFEFVDNEVEFGEIHTHHFYYYIKAYNSGSNTYSSESNTLHLTGIYSPYKEPPKLISNDISEFTLNQNYPNPFNPKTLISFSVSENSLVSLKVYDVLANEISELVNELKEPGNYTVSFDASKLSSGIYFYTLKANGYSLTKKMLLVK